MKFKHGTRRKAIEYEKDVIKKWKADKTFEKSVRQRSMDNSYVFYDGPPFITGSPHHGTLLSSIVKDCVPRYWAMKGKRVERLWGWDCHGLPAENFVEKQLGITDRRDIGTKVSLEEYITKARESMVAHSKTWEATIDRIGRWVDFKGAYKTMDKDFMESVWWAFKELYNKGKIYEGEKVLMYDTKFATPVSKNEVTMDNDAYQTVTDPSIYVKFRMKKSIKSFIMGCEDIDDDLKKLDVEFTKQKGELGTYYSAIIPENQTENFEKLIVEKMKPDFFNEYIVDGRGIFIFKLKDGKVERYVWSENEPNNEKRIGELIAEMTGSFDGSICAMWEDNDFYGKDILRNTYFLAWTTTPWTLPANTALAVNPELDYIEVKVRPNNKVFLISGKHAFASRHYFPKLKNELESQGYDVTIIDHVNHSSPNYAENLELLKEYDLNDANIITHSLGAPTFLSFLDKNDVKVNSLTMIAPGYPGRNVGSKNQEWLETSGYVGYELDFANIRKKIANQPVILYSDNDAPGRRENAEELGEELNAAMILEPGKRHFFNEDGDLDPNYRFNFDEIFVIAKDLANQVLVDNKKQPIPYEILNEFKGERLIGKKYEPLFKDYSEGAHQVYGADYVGVENGTGIVHIAPIYGEEDFELAEKEGISKSHVIDDNGYYFSEIAEQLRKVGVRNTDETGIEVWESNKFIAKCLQEKGIVWKIDYIRHEYPFNPRSGQRIMYRAIPSWFFDIQNSKPLMLEQNENINWFPNHIKHGRFEKNIEQAPDWNISRSRFWATAMPIWKGDNGTIKVIGSYAELKDLSGTELEDYHRPWVDQIEFDIDGEHFKRIDKVLDCWFESGSMPFAQFHYPFENKEKFETNFPGDFIVEYVAQVRAWFYYVHVINTALFGTNAFKDVIVTGTVAGNDGRKMSKSLGNFTDPNELMDKFSADSLRLLLLSSPLLSGEDFALQDKDVGDVARKLNMIWNMYDFFTMYAEVDKWEFVGELISPENLKNPLDIWIVSRLHQLIVHITKHMDEYDISEAISDLVPFIDDASNWFVRRSRRRFWKSEDDTDKNDAYRTLHYVLVRIAEVMAPFTPFLAEELWDKVIGGESVHLRDWPTAGYIDEVVLEQMKRTREVIEKGLALRMERDDDYGQIKVRQPLSSLTYTGDRLDDFYEQIIIEEVNVKKVKHDLSADSVFIDKKLTEELKQEGLARELIRLVQNARKDASLNIDDRIQLSLKTDSPELKKAIQTWQKEIQKETLATKLTEELYHYQTTGKLDEAEIQISLIAAK